MNSALRILLTGSGAPGWVSIFNCLKNANENTIIYGSDIKSNTAGMFYAHKHRTLPLGTHLDYISELEKYIQDEKIDVILPLTDPELLPLAKYKTDHKTPAIAVSSYASLEQVVDKIRLYQQLKKSQIAVPNFVEVTTWKEFSEALDILQYPTNTVCFKPAISSGSRGFRIITDKAMNIDTLLHQKPTTKYITYKEIKQILGSVKNFPRLVVMEYLPGDEYSVDVFIKDGKAKYIIPRKRILIKEGITNEGIIEKSEKIIEESRKIASILALDYAFGIQFKYDSKGKPKILEVNPRLQGTSVHSYAAGVNLPYLAILSALGQKLPHYKITYNIHMYRHWQEVYFLKNKKVFTS